MFLATSSVRFMVSGTPWALYGHYVRETFGSRRHLIPGHIHHSHHPYEHSHHGDSHGESDQGDDDREECEESREQGVRAS